MPSVARPEASGRLEPPPAGPWLMAQSWSDLLFAHWAVPLDALRRVVPPTLEIDTYDGRAYVGVVPFRMTHVHPRGLPDVPGLSTFPELNVRTYVRHRGRPGVCFFSLDAANPVAVWAARTFFHLPYFRARMAVARSGVVVRYASHRAHRGAPPAGFSADYWATGPVFRAAPGSLEEFLSARFRFFAADRRGRVWRAEVDHQPWPLQPAAWESRENTLTAALGIPLDGPPLLHVAERVDVRVWPARRDG